uniref:Ribosomal protein S20 n=1 Tax=Trepomonas sp. PC1 TaxID=1076344 RepID=A0A146KBP0_9EUKA|eukprot:JAP93957.1 Ribosomal protein S20 [Trepomonas sp. PC1]
MEGEKKDIQDTKKYKLVLVSKDLPLIENYCRHITNTAKNSQMEHTGVTRYPVKRLCITTRKSPCGNGSNTWDHFEMRMFKRSLALTTTKTELQTLLKQCKNPAGIQVTLQEDQ